MSEQDSNEFQSTLSVRRATVFLRGLRHILLISIHALREESDRSGRREGLVVVISIHALREESDKTNPIVACSMIFQSTLSVRRATYRSERRG